MNEQSRAVPRVMFVATGSGTGKTTVTCGILKALINRKLSVSSFKCGPDYIDPMFHSKIIGAKSTNLDLVLCGEETVKFLLAKNAMNCDFSVIEGVMGMYDGLGFDTEFGSSNHLSQVTDTPQILIVNVKGMSLSAVAIIGGFINFKQNNIKGIILNHCSQAMFPFYQKMVEKSLDIPVYGYFPFIKEASIESRHLGLVTADEIEDINDKLELLAKTAEECINIDGLLLLGQSSKEVGYKDLWQHIKPKGALRIAVAKDEAFCFFYQDNLDLLKKLGAELIYFSPLLDKELPPKIDGLLLYGGYPEEQAKKLSENKTMLKSVKLAVENNLPTIAECGGFMYLLEGITDKEGVTYEMVSLLKGTARMTDKLSRFGYIDLTATTDTLLCKSGDKIKAHEFHYSDSDNNGTDFIAVKRAKEWSCIHATTTLFAGYPHLHFGANTSFAVNFINQCLNYKELARGKHDIR
ncbi:MAG: cobyrinate a,c-diamide synthase [Oscillospiraceae bacterium]